MHQDIINADLGLKQGNSLRPLKLKGKFAGMHSARSQSNPRVGGHTKGALSQVVVGSKKSPFVNKT